MLASSLHLNLYTTFDKRALGVWDFKEKKSPTLEVSYNIVTSNLNLSLIKSEIFFPKVTDELPTNGTFKSNLGSLSLLLLDHYSYPGFISGIESWKSLISACEKLRMANI